MLLCLLCLCLLGCKKNLTVDSFPGVNIERIICFEPSGNIIWKCSLEEIRQKSFSSENHAVGLGYFGLKTSKAIVFFGYNSSKNSLTSQKAVNIEEVQKCECFKKLKGEVLDALNQYSYAKKGFQQRPFSIILLYFSPGEPRLDLHFEGHFYLSGLPR